VCAAKGCKRVVLTDLEDANLERIVEMNFKENQRLFPKGFENWEYVPADWLEIISASDPKLSES